ncbi:septin and tuftelin-interacting protein 1 homolog 1-like [Zingiber officinale]|uniref:G-patch domain-containing protein n=1 Tax=Zingiber officinale TaxID=94328 RepID=A0A8J5HXR6_ZINOF|nr:septin and tuftelin-interacting protein 1 homolog 1-like [Zingiber officinale]KAG6531935.1 hypothetical protein ZIOFF_005771 [Zingiber officinale]
MADDFEGLKRFGMENDYEGCEWIRGEFYYRSKKERPGQTRDDAINGAFSTASSDSYSDGGGRLWRKRRKGDFISKADLSKPVQFVSTGTVMPSQEIKRDPQEEGDRSTGVPTSGHGLGYGLRFQSNRKEIKGDEDAEDEDGFLSTAVGRRIKEGAQRREKEKESERGRPKLTKNSSGRRDASGASEMGKFEAHTKGIGSKLMKKMGFTEGSGLGKNEQGIVAPVEAKLRPKNMGIGFNGYKEAKLPVLDEAPKEKMATPVAAGPSKEKRWLKQKRGRPEAEILTADEPPAKKQEQGNQAVQKVLYMRGPQVQVLTSLDNLNTETEMKENDVPTPELLQYNVRQIVESTEVDIQKLDQHLRREREKVVCLQEEKDKIMKEVMQQRKQLHVMQTIELLLEKVKEDSLSGVLTLDSLLTTFKDLKEIFKDDYKLFNISCIVLSFAYPLFLRVFHGWQALQNPLLGVNLISSWRDLLQGDQPYDFSENPFSGSYSQLISELILPAVRISVTNTWQARDPEPLLRFLEIWEKLLPPVILQSILENVVMPKLTTTVDSWDPRCETVPIHVWVHPWLPLLGQRLETLYHTISYKLGSVLHAWHASDASAYAILSPWKDVFDAASWEHLMVHYIVPKLKLALQEFQVTPANQKLDQFNWVMMWASAIPIHHMVHMLEVDFFSKWQQVLYHWLRSDPNFNEVMQWYMGWKGVFPAELLANERIRVLLCSSLDMMNQAVEGMEVVQPGATENVSRLRAIERQLEAQQKAPTYFSVHVIDVNAVGVVHELSFKESIEAYAMEQGWFFKPKVGRYYNDRPVFGFGNISICIDSVNKLLYARVNGSTERWSAVTLTQLQEMHRNTSRH